MHVKNCNMLAEASALQKHRHLLNCMGVRLVLLGSHFTFITVSARAVLLYP